MSKFGLQMDRGFKPADADAASLRNSIRRTVHPPERPAARRTMFFVGVAVLVVACASLFIFH